MQQEPVYACHKCKEELVFEVKIGRRDTCPNCHAYLHCCFNCRFWDPNVHNECTENRSEFIRDRAEGNFCLYFTFRATEESAAGEQEDSKAKLNSLFGDSGPTLKRPSPKTSDEARSRLDSLFKD